MNEKGYITLIEILIIAAIIGILAAIAIPLYNNVQLRERCRKDSMREECQRTNNGRMIEQRSDSGELACVNGVIVEGNRARCR